MQVPTQFAHTLNATACAVPRMIVAILENNQQVGGRRWEARWREGWEGEVPGVAVLEDNEQVGWGAGGLISLSLSLR